MWNDNFLYQKEFSNTIYSLGVVTTWVKYLISVDRIRNVPEHWIEPLMLGATFIQTFNVTDFPTYFYRFKKLSQSGRNIVLFTW